MNLWLRLCRAGFLNSFIVSVCHGPISHTHLPVLHVLHRIALQLVVELPTIIPELTMTNLSTLTSVHLNEELVATDLHDEALALAQRVTHKLRTPTPTAALSIVEDEYEPHSVMERKVVNKSIQR